MFCSQEAAMRAAQLRSAIALRDATPKPALYADSKEARIRSCDDIAWMAEYDRKADERKREWEESPFYASFMRINLGSQGPS